MSIQPISDFPLLPSDQADVIEIFLDLMRNAEPDATANQPVEPRSNASGLWPQGDLPDLA